MKTKILFLIPLIALLSACGGSSTDSTGTVSLLVTDNLSSYSEVWINLQSVTATDSNNQNVSLFRDTTGQTHNLSQLVNIGALVDVQKIAAGTYTSFEVVLGNTVTLVDGSGTVIIATFDQSGNPTFSTTVTGTLTVTAGQATTLALDFDLARFTFDAGTNTVTPVVVQKDPAMLNQTVSTIFGEVEYVISGSSFRLDPQGNGRHLTVNLASNATVTNATGTVMSDTSGLSNDLHVIVTGNYDAATQTITASSVEYGSNAASLSHKLEGTIDSLSGGTATIDIHEANFMPGANTLVVDLSNAAFSHGRLVDLAVGQKLELKGSWDSVTFTPTVVEIEGYSSNSSSHSYMDDYAEIKGAITAVNSDQLTLTVQEREHVTGINIGSSVTINSSNSWIEHGNSSCLVVGAVIEAKGPMSDATTMAANKIEIESGC